MGFVHCYNMFLISIRANRLMEVIAHMATYICQTDTHGEWTLPINSLLCSIVWRYGILNYWSEFWSWNSQYLTRIYNLGQLTSVLESWKTFWSKLPWVAWAGPDFILIILSLWNLILLWFCILVGLQTTDMSLTNLMLLAVTVTRQCYIVDVTIYIYSSVKSLVYSFLWRHITEVSWCPQITQQWHNDMWHVVALYSRQPPLPKWYTTHFLKSGVSRADVANKLFH